MRITIQIINDARKELMGKYYKPIGKSQIKNFGSNLITIRDVGILCFGTTISLTRKSLVIEDLFVSKKFRNQGIGTELIKEVIKIAKKMKVDCIEVCAKDSNKIAQRLYKKFGFEDRKNIALRLWLNKKR